MEAYPAFRGDSLAGRTPEALRLTVLLVLVVEIAIKMGAFGSRPWLAGRPNAALSVAGWGSGCGGVPHRVHGS